MTEHSKPIRLATTAYHAALANRWQAAADAILRINEECGGEGLNDALMAWCDTYYEHAADGQTDVPMRSAIGFVAVETGEFNREGSDRVPAEVQWAGALISARVAMDRDRWVELIDGLPDDGAVIGQHVLAVLRCTAMTINGFPRGFALMGRSGGAQ